MLEPDALKGARPVLRGGGGGDPTSLPDYRKAVFDDFGEGDGLAVDGDSRR